MKRVAVVSDATSSGFLFQKWLSYYGALFGSTNLYLITYEGLSEQFRDSGLGFVWELQAKYNDSLRAKTISSLVSTLLQTYDVVIRCDIDEFLVPDRRHYPDLRNFIEQTDLPYVTAIGIDIVEGKEDGVLRPSEAILFHQRRFAVRSSALNKTSITRVGMRWAEGFHAATVFPIFNSLYNFHLKFADIRSRIDWFEQMVANAATGSTEYEYFRNGKDKLTSHQIWCISQPTGDESDFLNISKFDRRFLASVNYNSINGIYQGKFEIDQALFTIPYLYAGVF